MAFTKTICPKCGNVTAGTVKRCPRCNAKLPTSKGMSCGSIAITIICGLVLVGLLSELDCKSTSSIPSGAQTSSEKWYEGGTLHNKSALEWQNAARANKLATCADFVTTIWQNGNLKPSIANNISTVDDVRPYARELVNFLDAAFKPNPNPEQNRKLFTNQTVSGAAAIGMVTIGWTK